MEPAQLRRIGRELLFLLLSLPLGIAGFVFVVTMTSVGAATALVWVGVPVLMLLLVGTHRLADLERRRVRGLLATTVPRPYRPLPHGPVRSRWFARARDAQTWRDAAYLLILLPVGIAEFALVVTLAAVSLAMTAIPLYYRFLPEGVYAFPSPDLRWVTVDSVTTALPWMALGVLLACAAVPFTHMLAACHVRLAWALLGPTARRIREVERDTRVAGGDGPSGLVDTSGPGGATTRDIPAAHPVAR